MKRTHALALALAVVAGQAGADCATDEAIAAYVKDYMAKVPAAALVPDGSMEDARCTQDKLIEALVPEMGEIVGYKAGLTSGPAQERFGVTEPVAGVLYADMLLEDGASVPLSFGARPLFEADLILVIGDDAINDATTPEEAMAHISAVQPFIELPDLVFKEGEPINGITLTANGVMTGLVLHQVVGGPRIDSGRPHDGHMPPQGEVRQSGPGFNIRAFMRNLPEEQREIARDRFEHDHYC